MVGICQQVFNFGLQEHDKRQNEVNEFYSAVEEAKTSNIKKGVEKIGDFNKYRKKVTWLDWCMWSQFSSDVSMLQTLISFQILLDLTISASHKNVGFVVIKAFWRSFWRSSASFILSVSVTSHHWCNSSTIFIWGPPLPYTHRWVKVIANTTIISLVFFLLLLVSVRPDSHQRPKSAGIQNGRVWWWCQ